MAAYTNGRRSVTLYDCLLLQHVLWQRPEEAQRIGDWLLQELASDGTSGLQQLNFTLRRMRAAYLTVCVIT